jgi:MFS family permease
MAAGGSAERPRRPAGAGGRGGLSWRARAAIAGAGIFIGSFDLGAISGAMAPVERLWHVSAGVVTTLGTATLVGMLVGSLVTGVLSDRLGRRSLIVADAALFLIGALGSALAPDFAALAAARLVTGLAIGADFAVVFPFVSEIVPRSARGRAMAWIMWAANFGVLCAYGLGAAFLAVAPQGWRLTFGVGVLLAAPILALRSLIGESDPWRAERLASLGLIARALSRREQRRPLLASAASTLLYQLGDQGLTLVLPLLLASVLGASAAAGAAGATAVKAVTIPAALLTVLAIERIGRRPLQAVGFLARAAAFGALGALLLAVGHLAGVWVGALLGAGFFFGAAGPDKTTVIVPAEHFSTPTRASGQAISQAAGRLGGILGVTLYGVLAAAAGPGAGMLLFAASALLGGLATLAFIPETRQRRACTTAERDGARPGPALPTARVDAQAYSSRPTAAAKARR